MGSCNQISKFTKSSSSDFLVYNDIRLIFINAGSFGKRIIQVYVSIQDRYYNNSMQIISGLNFETGGPL